MVDIIKENENFVFELKGMHKLWAFKSSITIPASHIVRVYQDDAKLEGWKGWRFPGTSIPFVITAGTYHTSGETNFWDVTDKKNCIVIDLADEQYDHLIIDVENPEAAIGLLTA